jgi:hypothetical protein
MKSARENVTAPFHFIMVFIDKGAPDVETLRMTFSRRVTVVTINKVKITVSSNAAARWEFPAGGFFVPLTYISPHRAQSSRLVATAG